MKLIVCFDKNFGMLRDNKRPTRDEAVLEDIHKFAEGKSLYISKGSANMLEGKFDDIHVCNDPVYLSSGTDAACFVESPAYLKNYNLANYIITYCWNEDYECDQFFLCDLSEFTKIHEIDFAGEKHKRITRTVYCK